MEECVAMEKDGWRVVIAGGMNIAPERIDGYPDLRTFPYQHVLNRGFLEGGLWEAVESGREKTIDGGEDKTIDDTKGKTTESREKTEIKSRKDNILESSKPPDADTAQAHFSGIDI
jgi:hypothetical protein